jgi:hypothetical protein
MPYSPSSYHAPPSYGTLIDLVRSGNPMDQYRVQSRAALGSILGNFGAQLGQGLGEHWKKKKQEKEDAMLGQLLGSFKPGEDDPQQLLGAATKIAGPDRAGKLVASTLAAHSARAQMEQLKQTQDEKESLKIQASLRDRMKTITDSWGGMSPEMKQAVWGGVGRPYAMGVMGKADLPEQLTPELDKWIGSLASKTTLKPGEREFQGGVEVASNPKEPPQAAPAQVGSFTDFVARKYGPDPTPDQVIVARKEYGQADDKAPRITISSGGGSAKTLDQMPSEWRGVVDRAVGRMPSKTREFFTASIGRAWETGDQKEVADMIRQAAIEGENVDTRNQVLGRVGTVSALHDMSALLKKVPTNMAVGTMENLVRKLGTSTNPEYAELGNALMSTLIQYRRAATGVQFSERENADYLKMFPNYRNTLPVNLALIRGLEESMASYDRAYWKHKLGEKGAELIGVLPGSSYGGGAAPAAPATPRREGAPPVMGTGKKRLRFNPATGRLE